MDKTRLNLVVLAALLHDIGKLMERGGEFSDARQSPECLSVCRQDPVSHRPTHLHAAYTFAFCDWLEDRFACLSASNTPEWKEWCARHHRDDESGLEYAVIRQADRLSSSEREEGQYYTRDIHRRTLLEPVLEKVCLQRNGNCLATFHRYDLLPLSMENGAFFAKPAKELGLPVMDRAEMAVDDPSHWSHLLAEEPLTEGYGQLCQGLLRDIEALAAAQPGLDLSDLVVTMMTLLERYTTNVPSATNVRHPDIALFDHLRTTATIAQALYLEQLADDQPERGVVNKDVYKWRLVCGDFSGIQKFIYNLTNKGAAKGLRGRSFFVQYFCRVCSDYLMHRLGVTRAALLYNSGGKFYLMIPAKLQQRLYDIRRDINRWLLDSFEGTVFLGLGCVPVNGEMFAAGTMSVAWKQAAEDLEKDRTTCFSDLFNTAFFAPDTAFDPSHSCEICGSRRLAKGGKKCATCLSLEDIGAALRNSVAILTVWGPSEEGAARLEDRLQVKTHRRISLTGLGVTGYLLSEDALPAVGNSNASWSEVFQHVSAECTFLNALGEMPFADLVLPGCAVSRMYLGRWESNRQRHEDGTPWDFDDYARHAQGVERLGILRMDVDNLGMVFIEGLRFPERESVTVDGKARGGWGAVKREADGGIRRRPMATMSRMATLSRQLELFFSGHVTYLLTRPEYDLCQVIYAGGDDLFIIGAWHQLPSLAKRIRSDFGLFCCNNPDFSISGGITLQRGRYPLYKGAQLAGKAEYSAKQVRRERCRDTDITRKDGFNFLDVPILWEDFNCATAIRDMMAAEIAKNRGLLRFLMQATAANHNMVRLMVGRSGGSMADAWDKAAYTAWRWRTAYQLRRRFGRDDDTRRLWSETLFADQTTAGRAHLPVFSWLYLPLRWVDYLHRNKGEAR